MTQRPLHQRQQHPEEQLPLRVSLRFKFQAGRESIGVYEICIPLEINLLKYILEKNETPIEIPA